MVIVEPAQSQDPFEVANQFLDTAPFTTDTFQASFVPSSSGFGTRQSRIPNRKPATTTRHVMQFLVPEGPIVQLYINPQNVTYSYKKAIFPQRTKAGFAIQYWGEDLTTLRLTGTTGTSGIEGINVLSDIYRNEQLAFDPYALFLAAQNNTNIVGDAIGGLFGGGSTATSVGGAIGGLIQSGIDQFSPVPTTPKPSLAQLAFSVELYWSGEVYRGYFTSFTVTERADNLGMFDYDMEYMVTQKRGFRQNFLPWHRSATSGQSNSDPRFGIPYSFAGSVRGENLTPQLTPVSDATILENIAASQNNIINFF